MTLQRLYILIRQGKNIKSSIGVETNRLHKTTRVVICSYVVFLCLIIKGLSFLSIGSENNLS